MRLDRRGLTSGSIAVLVLQVLVYVGSEGLGWFHAALAPYLLGTLLAVFAVVYRYVVWLRRPPTALLNQRGWEAFRRPGRHRLTAPVVGDLHPAFGRGLD